MATKEIVQAFALGFPSGEGAPPTVVARGDFDIAGHMVEVAKRYGIPVVERPEMCALLAEIEVGTSIPESLFRAAAALLVEIGVLEERGSGGQAACPLVLRPVTGEGDHCWSPEHFASRATLAAQPCGAQECAPSLSRVARGEGDHSWSPCHNL